ncbi:TonB-dependent receptor plug domain-containing protein [Anthocerotibacter panamensis]|uniref:TonB-dependent receptor plug domain-containing protein n=1 Tax=Anthocerotibacter panamensis TaxID=2857077 RepID=UPI001C402D05|nr:TonB-dependent receptor [Anthocerotibacter panamensis]
MLSYHRRTKRSHPRQRLWQILCLGLLLGSIEAAAQAEEVVTAQALAAYPAHAQDLAGLHGTFSPSVSAPTLVAQQGADASLSAAEGDEPVDLLSETNITAQRRRTSERENTQTTYVVTRADIKASGATTISDALRLVPGFTLTDSLGGIDNRGFNSLRGLDDARFVFLEDGRPFTNPSNGRNSQISSIPTVDVERIEVVTGGATLRYGADAVAGVINVITRVPEGPPKLTANIQLGSFGFSQYNLEYSGSTGDLTTPGNVAYQLGYVRQSAYNDYPYSVTVPAINGDLRLHDVQNGVPIFGNSQSTPFSFTNNAFGLYVFEDYYYGKLIFSPGKDHRITLFASQQNTRRGDSFLLGFCGIVPANFRASNAGGAAYSYCYTPRYLDYLDQNFGTSYRGRGDNREDETVFNLTWDWNLSELNTLTTQVDYRTTFGDFPSGGGQHYLDDRSIQFQTRYTAQLYPGNTLNTGFQYITNRSSESPFIGAANLFLTTLPGGTPINPVFLPNGPVQQVFDREISRWAVYFTEDLRFFDDTLILNLGSRLTNDNQFGTFTTSGVGIRYNFLGERGRETFGLRANWSQSFKAAGLAQLYALFAPGTQISLPNPQLRPENGSGYDIGLDIALSPTALLRVTHYRIDLTNAILENAALGRQQDTEGNGLFYRFFQTVNAQASLSTGWDFTFNWKLDPHWDLLVSQSFIDARPVGVTDADPGGATNPINGGYFYGFQTQNIPNTTTGLQLRYTSAGFNAALIGLIVGERPVLATFTVPGYARFDLTTSIPLTSNLTFTGAINNLFNANYQLFSANLSYPAPGMTFRVGLETTF